MKFDMECTEGFDQKTLDKMNKLQDRIVSRDEIMSDCNVPEHIRMSHAQNIGEKVFNKYC